MLAALAAPYLVYFTKDALSALFFKVLPFLLAALAGAIVVIAIWKSGYNAAMRENEVKTMKTVLATVEKDRDLERGARIDADLRYAVIKDQNEANAKKVAELSDELSHRKDNCPLSADDARRLRDIKPVQRRRTGAGPPLALTPWLGRRPAQGQ